MSLSHINRVLILGDGGIGYALAEEINSRNPKAQIHISSRQIKKNSSKFILHFLDPLKESSWQKFIIELREQTTTLDLVISTYGVLHNLEGIKPEKSLREIDIDKMIEVFSINAFTAPLVAKNLEPFLNSSKESHLIYLSAKVGSLQDNGMGGWYSYRASKAALNMFMKNISIEFSRKNLKTKVYSIHPGTTVTKLSEPFLKSSNLKIWSSEETAKHILNTIYSTNSSTGSFLNWNGEVLPW
jgi:NAD(P)-dependent dehydrogenase (short-subunit alcohol dehydrogenase family)